ISERFSDAGDQPSQVHTIHQIRGPPFRHHRRRRLRKLSALGLGVQINREGDCAMTSEAKPALDGRAPSGPMAEKWQRCKNEMKLVSPTNKRKFDILVVGTGLAGASAAASLGELGYNVKAFCFQDSARRAHSIAAQGGINAAKNYQNDGDSVW